MVDSSITLALEGEVVLSRFAEALTHFYKLIDSLTAEIAPNAEVRWVIEVLEAGSALTTVTGYADDVRPVLSVVHGAEQVALALEQNEVIPFGSGVRKHAALVKVVGNGVNALRLETAQVSSLIYSSDAPPGSPLRQTFGTVKGTVESLNSRRSLRFVLYDSVTDRAITCYVENGQEALLRDIWGKRVMVNGRLTRHPESGAVISVREVTAINVLETPQLFSYRRARGAFEWRPGDEPAATTIRRIRDAEN
jgi:hypothetical protein